MRRRPVIMAAAWLEIVVGAVLITAPGVLCRLLFAAKPERVGLTLARFAGIGLFALGIACLPSATTESDRSAVGLFLFNFGMVILLAWVGATTELRGVLLWPVVVLHAMIATALLPQFLTSDRRTRREDAGRRHLS